MKDKQIVAEGQKTAISELQKHREMHQKVYDDYENRIKEMQKAQ